MKNEEEKYQYPPRRYYKNENHCIDFEDKVLDFQLLGIGRNGHIGFNE